MSFIRTAGKVNSGGPKSLGQYVRGANKFVLLLAVFAIAYALESTFDLNEMFDEFLEEHEDFEADVFFFGIIIPALSFLGLSFLETKHEVRARRKAEQEALHLAFHDSLTGLPNRRKLETEMETICSTERRAVLMLDLDDFKPINDIFGHAAGDAVLLEAARRLAATCGSGDLVCRFGGDEFAVLTGAVRGIEEAELLARRILAAIDKPFMAGQAETKIGVSIGVALFNPGVLTAADALRHADLALYRAKEDRHCGVLVFENKMDEELRRRNLMERRLRTAIELGAVCPHFMPLVDLKTGAVIGFEALARWTDPELGFVPPDEFIALAEDAGIITVLSDHLLRAACREAMRWPSNLKLSFNLSPKQLQDELIGLRVLNILGETGFPPQRLEIEVTESSLAEDKDQARALLTSLRNAGIGVAIDDFGTGYSSLYHLREFKFDNLKIDRSFITTMESGSVDEVIVNAMLSLSRGLGLASTAEGIERDDQRSKLIAAGCERGQGYLFGRAMTGASVQSYLASLSGNEAARA